MKKIILLLFLSTLSVWATCSADLDMGNNTVVKLGTPTADSHAATKKYFDDLLSTLSADDIKGLYGTIKHDGKTWLNKNLGAQRVAQSLTDSEGYGDLYQWGRKKDGHEDRSSGTASEQEASNPNHGLFIIGYSNWRSVQDDDLWNSTGTGVNEVCPSGYRLPIEAEFAALSDLHGSDNFSNKIRLPYSGFRDDNGIGTNTYYWTSTTTSSYAKGLNIYSGGTGFGTFVRYLGMAIRCIKN